MNKALWPTYAVLPTRQRWDGVRKPHIKLVAGVWRYTEFTQFSREAALFCLALNIKRIGGA